MVPRDPKKTKAYLKKITARRGGVDALMETLAKAEPRAEALEGALESFPVQRETPAAAARAALEALERNQDPAPGQMDALEAIIIADLRPAFDIVDGRFTADHQLWRHLSTGPALAAIETVIPLIGRIELPGQTRIPYGGTGFVVGTNLIMTNRHVAEIFASGLGSRNVDFRRNARAGINFTQELGRTPGQTLSVRRVAMIHPYWDMALLEVEGLPAGHKFLRLSQVDARDLVQHETVVIGYPAFDSRNPTGEQNTLFRKNFGVKRLQPGDLQGGRNTSSFGKVVSAATHDCSTLGGNSGSAVISIATGEVFGLHFGGLYHDTNFAVPAAELAKDARVIQAGVRFVGDPGGGPTAWDDWWTRADSSIEIADEADGPMTASSTTPTLPRPATPPAIRTVANGGSGVRIELRSSDFHAKDLSLSFFVSGADGVETRGAQATESPSASATPVDALEAMREPFHDTEYSSRDGYNPAFLGSKAEFKVPLPGAKDASIVAPTLKGGRELDYENFTVMMHAKRRLALFTASNVTKEPALRTPEKGKNYTRKGLSGLGENDQERWFLDHRMDAKYQLPDVFFTKDRKAFDKGHIVRREDVAWGKTFDTLRRANGDTYHVTNCSPQVAQFNQSARGEDNWGDLENHVLKSSATERLCVFAGPVLGRTDTVFEGKGDDGVTLRARIPSRFWKVIVARTEVGLAAFGFVLEQDLDDVAFEELPATEFVVPDNFRTALERISAIERMTGVVFDPAIRDADQFDSQGATEMVFVAGLDVSATA